MAEPQNTETATIDVPTVSEQVNVILKAQETDKLVLPEGISEHVADVARAEHKFRSTQSSYTKANQLLRVTQAENEVLKGHIKPVVAPEEQKRLDDLKFTDPDAWFVEMSNLKAPDIGKETREKAGADYEFERRVGVLEEFNKGRAVPITDELILNDIPPRISNKLANGQVEFEAFLEEVDAYLSKGKVLPNVETMSQTDLGKITGGDIPTKEGPKTEHGRYIDLANSDMIL